MPKKNFFNNKIGWKDVVALDDLIQNFGDETFESCSREA